MRRHRTRTADAVVVLGCRAPAALKRRVERGVELFQQAGRTAPGAVGRRRRPDLRSRDRCADAALARGVPRTALLIEAGSRNTYENARETARLLGSRGSRSVMLVSDRVHLPRAVTPVSARRIAGRRLGRTSASARSNGRPASRSTNWPRCPAAWRRALFRRRGAGRLLRPRLWRSRSAEKSRGC